MSWKPRVESQKMLDYALAKIKSVPYAVTARWTFYQLVQAGIVEKKKGSTFEYLTSKARKQFYGGWNPSLLEDSVRSSFFKGEREIYFDYIEDTISEQDIYLQLWFEAEAMHGQFEHYTKDYRVSLQPFRGDCSIPIKWKLAKKLEHIAEEYNKPINILYFGDYDKKGLQIFNSALKDIRQWCNSEFEVERIGLTIEQAKTLSIPENPNKPGTYQWEALNDEQAGQLIVNAVEKYVTKPSQEILNLETEVHSRTVKIIQEFLEQYQ